MPFAKTSSIDCQCALLAAKDVAGLKGGAGLRQANEVYEHFHLVGARAISVTMDAEDRRDDGSMARESRFVNLIQPNRDMAANWSVDVGKQLENYLEDLKAAGLFDDDDSPLNFAEAALLIQGSIQVYSRKVEYLYNLVLRALNFVSEKKQGHEGDKSPTRGAEEDCHRTDEEDNFLNLGDDIFEEGDIDVVDDEDSTVTHVMKVPPGLLVTEVEGSDMSGDAGELALYNVATCTLYRGFLLLDRVDTATVDRYLVEQESDWEENREATGAVPADSPLRDFTSTRSEDLGVARGSEGGAASTENIPPSTGSRVGGSEASWHGGAEEGMASEDCAVEDDIPDVSEEKVPEGGGEAGTSEVPPVDYRDPWEPLNPHEEGALTLKPFKKGPMQRVFKTRKDQSFPNFTVRCDGVFFAEFAKAMQVRQAKKQTGRRGEDHNDAENMKASSQNPDDGPVGSDSPNSLSGENTWDDLGDIENDEIPGTYDFETGDLGARGTAGPSNPFDSSQQFGVPAVDHASDVFESSPEFGQGTDGDNVTLEDLCRAHVDSVLQKLAESRARSGLTSRVTTWKNKIEVALKEDESRPAFDIHEVGDRLLETLSTSVAPLSNDDGEEEIDESFAFLVNGQLKDGVARAFSALLQLANNGNVLIDRGQMGTESQCFTFENPFRVKLLNAQGRDGGQFAHLNTRANVGPLSSRSNLCQSQANGRHFNSSQRNKTYRGVSSERPSPSVSQLSCKTPSSRVRIRSSTTMFISPSSTRRSSRKRGQSVTGRQAGGVVDVENNGVATPEKGYTPVKLTPNRRQTKRKPLQNVQIQ